MKKVIFALLMLCPAVASLAASELDVSNEDVFLSLTRTVKPIRQLPTNVSVITEEQIKERGAKTLDEIIDILPSVDVLKNGTLGAFGSVRLRAVPNSAQVQILIDDQPLNGVSNQSYDISQIPLENVERIEVVRGASSVLYGANTIGGVINIITKGHAPVPTRVESGFEARSFQTRILRAQAGRSTDKWDGLVTLSRYDTDGFQENSEAENNTATATGGYVFDNGARLSLDMLRIDHEIGLPGGTSVPFDQWNGEKERAAVNKTALAKRDQTSGKIRFSRPLAQTGRIHAMLFADDQDFVNLPRPGAAPISDVENRIAGGDARFVSRAGYTVGASYERDRRESAGSAASHITNYAGYVQHEYDWRKLYVSPALRIDHHGSFGNTVNPRLTAVYSISDLWLVSGNVARSYRAPSLVDLFFQSSFFRGNPNLKPETAWSYDVGNEFRFARGSSVKLTGFYLDIRDRISTTADFSTLENAPKAEISGVEAEASGQVGFISNVANYTFQRAVGNSSSSSRFVPLRLTPKHMANWLVTVGRAKGWLFTNTVQYVHKQYEGNDNTGFKHPGYTLWHVRLAKEMSFAELFFGVNNITDRRYAEAIVFTRYPQPGRTYWGGVNFRFPPVRNRG